ncbi:MAG: hypothetical protein WDN69_12825 [Aliidongia sp.]
MSYSLLRLGLIERAARALDEAKRLLAERGGPKRIGLCTMCFGLLRAYEGTVR